MNNLYTQFKLYEASKSFNAYIWLFAYVLITYLSQLLINSLDVDYIFSFDHIDLDVISLFVMTMLLYISILTSNLGIVAFIYLNHAFEIAFVYLLSTLSLIVCFSSSITYMIVAVTILLSNIGLYELCQRYKKSIYNL